MANRPGYDIANEAKVNVDNAFSLTKTIQHGLGVVAAGAGIGYGILTPSPTPQTVDPYEIGAGVAVVATAAVAANRRKAPLDKSVEAVRYLRRHVGADWQAMYRTGNYDTMMDTASLNQVTDIRPRSRAVKSFIVTANDGVSMALLSSGLAPLVKPLVTNETVQAAEIGIGAVLAFASVAGHRGANAKINRDRATIDKHLAAGINLMRIMGARFAGRDNNSAKQELKDALVQYNQRRPRGQR